MIPEKPSERFINTGMGLTAIGVLFIVSAVSHLPGIAAWLIETPVLTVMYAGMTLYKRNRWGWFWTAFVVVVSFVNLIAAVVPGLRDNETVGAYSWVVAFVAAGGWFFLIHMERHRKPLPVQPQITVNHHVFHGLPGGTAIPTYSADSFPVVQGADDHNSLRRAPSPKAIAAATVWGQTSTTNGLGRRVMSRVGKAVKDSW
jgi:hypothetical protein